MLRMMVAGLLVGFGCIGMLVADEPAPSPTPAPAPARQTPPEMIPDPTWQPKPGDRVNIHSDDAYGARSDLDLERFEKLRSSGDKAGIDDMLAKGRITKLTPNTSVLILDNGKTSKSSRSFGSGNDLASAVTQSATEQASVPKPSIEIRILDGPLKDQAFYVAAVGLARMIPKPPDPPVFGTAMVTKIAGTIMSPSVAALNRVRSGVSESPKADVLFRLPRNIHVEVIGAEDDWCQVVVKSNGRYSGRRGYVWTADLEEVVENPTRNEAKTKTKTKEKVLEKVKNH